MNIGGTNEPCPRYDNKRRIMGDWFIQSEQGKIWMLHMIDHGKSRDERTDFRYVGYHIDVYKCLGCGKVPPPEIQDIAALVGARQYWKTPQENAGDKDGD